MFVYLNASSKLVFRCKKERKHQIRNQSMILAIVFSVSTVRSNIWSCIKPLLKINICERKNQIMKIFVVDFCKVRSDYLTDNIIFTVYFGSHHIVRMISCVKPYTTRGKENSTYTVKFIISDEVPFLFH